MTRRRSSLLCSRNRLNSSSAEYCLADICDIKILLARTNSDAGDAERRVRRMGRHRSRRGGMQRDKLRTRHRFALECRKVVVLSIPDESEDIGMEAVRPCVAMTAL